MGFSLIGLAISIIIFAPNLLAIILPPKDVPKAKDAHIVFTILERLGQAGCMILPSISQAWFANKPIDIWFILGALCIIAYYGLWIRYAVKGQYFSLLFKPLAFIPIPMAIFPVLAFGFAAIWGQSIWVGIAAAVLAIGHLVNSWHTYIHNR